MHFLYCDETNLEKKPGDFLIYGGIMLSHENFGPLNREIDKIRKDLSVPKDYHLKFNPGPRDFSNPKFIELKEAVISSSIVHGAKLLVYAILHDIAKTPDRARLYGINTVCSNFNIALKTDKSNGLVLIDRFNDVGNQIDNHLRNKFSVGLEFNDGRVEKMEHILGYHYSCIGQSHIPSIVDVVLGSLRFAINCHTRREQKHLPTAKKLLELIGPMFWRSKYGDFVPELGFQYNPRKISVQKYKNIYMSLHEFLKENNIETILPSS